MKKFFKFPVMALTVAAMAMAFTACGDDDEPEDPSSGNNSGNNGSSGNNPGSETPAPEQQGNRLVMITRGSQSPLFSNPTYDEQGRIIAVTLSGKKYAYTYQTNLVTVKSTSAATRLYQLTNGRVTTISIESSEENSEDIPWKVTYNSEGQISKIRAQDTSAKEEQYPTEEGQEEQAVWKEINYTWTNGNPTLWVYRTNDNPDGEQRRSLDYGSLTTKTPFDVLPVVNNIFYIEEIDPVLLLEGYFGNSLPANLMNHTESTFHDGRSVNLTFSWNLDPYGRIDAMKEITENGNVSEYNYVWE